MSFLELGLTGLVALLAAVFSSLEAALNHNPLLWLRIHWGMDFGTDARVLSLWLLMVILAVLVFKHVLTIVQYWHMSSFSQAIGNAARKHILLFYLRAPYLWLNRKGTAKMLFGFTASQQTGVTLLQILQVLSNLSMILTIFLGLVAVAPVPAFFFLLVVGVGGYFIVRGTRKLLDTRARNVFDANLGSHMTQQLAVHSMKEMRIYNRGTMVQRAYGQDLFRFLQASRSFDSVSRLPIGALECLGFTSLIGVLLFLIYVQNAGIATVSGIMGFLAAAAWRVLPVANRAMESINSISMSLPNLNHLASILIEEKTLQAELVPLPDKEQPALPFEKNIAFDQVSFSYDAEHEPALDSINLNIENGSMVGIVGLSGAGKSTLVNILTGLIPADRGRVLVDGVPVTGDNVGAWLKNIGYVAQAPHLLDASLAENIALSRWGETIDRKRVEECCRLAALDFVDDLHEGIDTLLGEHGTRLSGGQVQRVAIARALYSDPKLLVFDEATSALDLRNEKAIQETILGLRKEITMVVIAHRLSTVRDCDYLIWLDKGRVRMSGTVQEVLPLYEVALQQRHGETPQP